MSYYDYKVVPAPRRAKRIKGAHSPEELFAMTLTEAISEMSRQGWEYLRAESMPAEAPRGWFRRPLSEQLTVLVFRRQRESLGPRLAAVAGEPAAAAREPATEAPPRVSPAEQPIVNRMQNVFARRDPPTRREPRVGEPGEAPPTPLRPAPRLGPAEQP